MSPEEIQRLMAIANGSKAAPQQTAPLGQVDPGMVPVMPQSAQSPQLNQPVAPSEDSGIINSAGNAAVAASQGLLQGTRNLQVGGGLLLRDITDAIGFTDPTVSKNIRQGLANDQKVTEASGEALGHPTLSKVGSVVGEYAPQFAAGGAAFKTAKGLLGGGRLADIGANALVGGVSGGFQDAGGSGLSGRLDNALNGAKWGAIMGTAFNGFGALKNKAVGFNVDPKKAEAFRTAGIQGTPSQLMDEATSPRVQNFYMNGEHIISKLPGFGVGLKKNLGKQLPQFQKYGKQVVDELEQAAPDNSAAFETIKSAMNSTGVHDVRQVNQYADIGLQRLNKVIGAKVNPATLKILEDVKNMKPTSFGDLHSLRRDLDDQLSAMAGDLGKRSVGSEFFELKQLRKTVSDTLSDIAKKNGAGKVWNEANIAHQYSLYAKAASKAFYDAFANKAGTAVKSGKVTGQFKNNTFTSKWNQLQDDMAELGLKPPPQMAKAVDNVTILANKLTESASTTGKGMGLLGTMVLGGAAGAAVYSADIESLAASTAVLAGLGLMLGTKSGVELLSKSKGFNTDSTRMALSVALGLGTAKQKQTEVQAQQQAQEAEIQRLMAIVNGARK